MANLNQKLAIFVAGSIAAASGAACTNSSPSKIDDTDLNRDDPSGEVFGEVYGPGTPYAVAVACGDFTTLGSDSPTVDDEGHIVVDDSAVTVSISADGNRRLTTSDNGLTFGQNTGIDGESTTQQSMYDLPNGDVRVEFLATQQTDPELPESRHADIVMNVDGTFISADAHSQGANGLPATVYANRILDEFGDTAIVTTYLESGIAHVGFEGNLADGQDLEPGEPFLSAEPLRPDMADEDFAGHITKALDDNSQPGDVVGLSVSNLAGLSDSSAQTLSCVSLAVRTEDLTQSR